jgi:hypothetical protein
VQNVNFFQSISFNPAGGGGYFFAPLFVSAITPEHFEIAVQTFALKDTDSGHV